MIFRARIISVSADVDFDATIQDLSFVTAVRGNKIRLENLHCLVPSPCKHPSLLRRRGYVYTVPGIAT